MFLVSCVKIVNVPEDALVQQDAARSGKAHASLLMLGSDCQIDEASLDAASAMT